jgi:predicted GNAT family acetyltransferase
MNVQHKQNKESGAFTMDDNGAKKAEMTYTLSAKNEMVINHTEVDKELRGKDIGQQLVKAAVDYSRKNGIKIIPVCSFAQAILANTDDYKDVLAEDE